MIREAESKGSIFDLPARRFVLGDGRDLSVRVHGEAAATPLGPAAGPHSQLAQNVVLAWLAGGRAIELKTVQVLDELEIPRPCIDAATVGYNIEWSQELRLEQSLEEYVKASMLIEALRASGLVAIAPGFERTVLDVSVGYDLAGLESPRVQAFLRGMMDATDVVARLVRQIPDDLARYRDLEYPARIARTATLSTFHGCPPDEIERMAERLLEMGLSCTIKLNPTLLGEEELLGLLHGSLGYTDVEVPRRAFERDATWEQATGIFERLEGKAARLGLGVGVKLTNTLIVRNHRRVLPGAEEMYLSGPPLHVLAMHLVRRFRRHFGDRFPVSFSGGIDWSSFADAVSLGLAPITVCTDWLRPGGYGRAHRYFDELARRMDRVGARARGDFIIRARSQGLCALARLGLDAQAEAACARALDEGRDLREAAGEAAYARWVSEAALLNTEAYVETLSADPRYDRRHNDRGPKKIGTTLELFDCLTCDKCVPVCPNDALFKLAVPRTEIPIVRAARAGAGWSLRREGLARIEEKHQIACFADACNECGNCDVFCPEDGGPHLAKPCFFGSREAFDARPDRDGLFVQREADRDVVLARMDGLLYRLEIEGDRARFEGEGFRVTLDAHDPEGTIEGEARGEVDLARFRIIDALRRAVLAPGEINFVSCKEAVEA
ncbi:MAG: glutamate synthase [Polyangiaceae bacterium]|nr:glutamate synthase [Polyangiaceae bacterium]